VQESSQLQHLLMVIASYSMVIFSLINERVDDLQTTLKDLFVLQILRIQYSRLRL
jgi:hypothetical protein